MNRLMTKKDLLKLKPGDKLLLALDEGASRLEGAPWINNAMRKKIGKVITFKKKHASITSNIFKIAEDNYIYDIRWCRALNTTRKHKWRRYHG